jgi:hypothetical protein
MSARRRRARGQCVGWKRGTRNFAESAGKGDRVELNKCVNFHAPTVAFLHDSVIAIDWREDVKETLGRAVEMSLLDNLTVLSGQPDAGRFVYYFAATYSIL